ncbi:branched-chain amino acid transport system II carrier protein, partial [Exiguobacterium sp.]|uniref:branched-chain amino acid transport system II carrier protein n=1 Tax=Exiguobacterium sp. TaxID=44751 RepID=UPI0028AD5966
MTTSVGLVTAFAEYMMTLSARITLKTASIFTTVLGLTVSIVGLQTLLSIAVPVLMFLYPIVIVLIALTFMRHLFRRKSVVYQSTLGVTIFFSLCSALNQLSLFPGNLKTFYQS